MSERIRSLREEIAYMRKNGYYRSQIELSTLLSWLGEQEADKEALKSAHAKELQEILVREERGQHGMHAMYVAKK